MHNFLATFRLTLHEDRADAAESVVRDHVPSALAVWASEDDVRWTEGAGDEREPRCTVRARVLVQSTDPRLPSPTWIEELEETLFAEIPGQVDRIYLDMMEKQGEGDYESQDVQTIARLAWQQNLDPATIPQISHLTAEQLDARYTPA